MIEAKEMKTAEDTTSQFSISYTMSILPAPGDQPFLGRKIGNLGEDPLRSRGNQKTEHITLVVHKLTPRDKIFVLNLFKGEAPYRFRYA